MREKERERESLSRGRSHRHTQADRALFLLLGFFSSFSFFAFSADDLAVASYRRVVCTIQQRVCPFFFPGALTSRKGVSIHLSFCFGVVGVSGTG